MVSLRRSRWAGRKHDIVMLLLLLLVGFAMNFVGNPRRTKPGIEDSIVPNSATRATGSALKDAAHAEALRRMDFVLARDLD